jgi:hypothetical protein
MTKLDRQKRGLQDDHDPSDEGQKSANKPRGLPADATNHEPDTPPDGDVTDGAGGQAGM